MEVGGKKKKKIQVMAKDKLEKTVDYEKKMLEHRDSILYR